MRLGEVARGSVLVETSMGDLDVGYEHVRNELDAADPPALWTSAAGPPTAT